MLPDSELLLLMVVLLLLPFFFLYSELLQDIAVKVRKPQGQWVATNADQEVEDVQGAAQCKETTFPKPVGRMRVANDEIEKKDAGAAVEGTESWLQSQETGAQDKFFWRDC